jgi:hypothetical protein
MSGKKRFEPEKIAAALKLLRALPVKDNRKTTGETLLMLKGGIQDALGKGYDRAEIRKTIAAAELPISATTFNDFLAANLKEDTEETETDAGAQRTTKPDQTPNEPEPTENGAPLKPESAAVVETKPATSENGKTADAERKAEAVKTRIEPKATGNDAPVKTETPAALERQAATQENGNAESVNRETPTIETRTSAQALKAARKLPSYYTPDLPDSEL